MRSSRRLQIKIRFATPTTTTLPLLLMCVASLLVAVECADRQTGARRVAPAAPASKFKSPCGTNTQVAKRVGGCMDPVFDIVYGAVAQPTSDADLVAVCERFATAEKCVRNTAKECLTGLQKTATSTVASATRRFRLQECKSEATRAPYFALLKCAIEHAKAVRDLYNNYTGISQAIRDLPKDTPEEKLMKGCCMLVSLDKTIESLFNRFCPTSVPLALGIIHAMTDDARSTLCVAPKCAHALDKVVNKPYRPPQNLIEPIMEIIFMINTD